MPTSNPLSFMRPLYDIAVWQFLLMSGYTRKRGKKGKLVKPCKVKFTYGMHKVVANFLCKLLEMEAFNHLKERLQERKAKKATGNWIPGELATKEIIKWCQDQWRRKKPCLPKATSYWYPDKVAPLPVAWCDNVPLCHECGVPCPDCREELGKDTPEELSTVQALMSYEDINKNDKKKSCLQAADRNLKEVQKKSAEGKGKTKKSEKEKCSGQKKQVNLKNTKEKEQVNRSKRAKGKKRKRQEAGRDKIEHQCSPPTKVTRAGDPEMSDSDVDEKTPGLGLSTTISDHSLVDLIPDPIAFYPLNSNYETREIKNRQPQGMAVGVRLAAGHDSKPNGSYEFVGETNSYVQLPSNRGLDKQCSITFLCWMYPKNTDGTIFNIYSSNKDYKINFYMIRGKLMFSGETLRGRGLDTAPQLITSECLTLNQWHYVGGSYDHNTGIAKLWLNGEQIAEQDIGGGRTLATQHNVKLGVSTGSCFPFKGLITALHIFDIALTEEQINALKFANQ